MPRECATILVVEDQQDTGHLMTRVLSFLGHQAVHVESGAQALSYVRASCPDAVLLDYMMPDMDGLAVLRQLRSDPRTRDLPVIMFSAESDPRVVACAMRHGASEYWVKASVGLHEMGARLARWLPGTAGDKPDTVC